MKAPNMNNASYLFHEGTNYKAYEYFGAHRQGKDYVFRVWAPNAEEAYVTGLFNGWSENDPMIRVDNKGIWEARISGEYFGNGFAYEFKFRSAAGETYKCDPYAFYSESYPKFSSRFFDLSGYKWKDGGWLESRANKYTREKVMKNPMNIYEVHPESWKKRHNGTFLSYSELAEELAPYAVQMGYTHIALMPVCEYYSGGAIISDTTGYFSPTSRFGDPKDFMGFVDTMHNAGIGVILEWNCSFFPEESHGISLFDGGNVYEYNINEENSGETTVCFDICKPEVQSFLISNAVYWADVYHIDGIKFDDISSMLSLDYNEEDCRFSYDIYGDRAPYEAANFFRKLNRTMLEHYPDVLMIAEDSGSRVDVTDFRANGLGFSLKWNKEWADSVISYASLPSEERSKAHNKIVDPVKSSYSQRHILPLSHMRVSFGNHSLVTKLNGTYDEKFAQMRVFMTYFMTQPGKKLSFMGNEISQFDEWDPHASIQWFLLDYEKHARYQLFCAELNNLYLKTPALWENDGGWDGFRWIDSQDGQRKTVSYGRIDASGKEIIAVFNFSSEDISEYYVGVPASGIYEEIFASDDWHYGGTNKLNGRVRSIEKWQNGFEQSLKINLPAYSACVFKRVKKISAK